MREGAARRFGALKGRQTPPPQHAQARRLGRRERLPWAEQYARPGGRIRPQTPLPARAAAGQAFGLAGAAPSRIKNARHFA